MEKWRRIWREGFVPHLPRRGLLALRRALLHDDPRLVQGRVSIPPPLDAVRDRSVEGACAVGFCGWQGEGHASVGRVLDFYDRTCELADAAFNEPAACRYFLNWFDDTPRADMRRELLTEVNLALSEAAPRAA